MSIATSTFLKGPWSFQTFGTPDISPRHAFLIRRSSRPRCMLRDPEWYPDPEAFRPERFQEMSASDAESRDPRKLVFGFGRR